MEAILLASARPPTAFVTEAEPQPTMKYTFTLFALVALASSLGLGACSSHHVQDARMSGVERRQNRMDSRTSARQDRWAERGAREDARAARRIESW